jgi:hypothetical protein
MRSRDRQDKATAAALRREMRADKKARRRAREEVRKGGQGWAAGVVVDAFKALGEGVTCVAVATHYTAL